MKNYEDVCKSKFLPTPLVSSHQELFFFRKKKKKCEREPFLRKRPRILQLLMILNTKYYGHYFVCFKKRIIYVCSHRKKKRTTKILEFFFWFHYYYSLSLSPSCQSPSSRATICDIYISIFLKAKKVGFIVLVPFEHLQSELLSKFTLTEMGEKKPHTHKLLFRDCTFATSHQYSK